MRTLRAIVSTVICVAAFAASSLADTHAQVDALLLDVQPLLARYAPHVNRVTLTSIIAVESSGWPWTINDNSEPNEPGLYLPSYEDAVRVARRLLAINHNIDLGVMQINSSNLAGLGVSVDQALVPERNIALAQQLLENARQTVIEQEGERILSSHEADAVRHFGKAFLVAHRDRVVRVYGAAWVRTHEADAARREVQLYHANHRSPAYLKKILSVAPHVALLLARAQGR